MRARARLAAGLASSALLLAGCAGTSPDEAVAPSSGSGALSSAAAEPTGQSPAAAPSPSGRQLAVEVSGGQASGDTGRVPVGLGEQVSLTVTSDAADQVHLHGYDITAELMPGQPSVLTFVADIPGVFEAELHDAGTVLLSLQVG